ncbi:MAG: DUF1552 domain-containing protein, partial [Myxococcales bacterium]|nr:DUF1552 domain-containing protein [Myxococcales bacterium]
GTLRRRAFLKGAGGIALGLPLLHSLDVDAGTPPPIKRLVLMYNPNGTIDDAFWPTSGGETDFVLGEMLAPLEAWRDKLLLLKGIDLKVTTTGPGGPHQRGIGGLFTGTELQEGDFADGCGSTAGWANGQSVDQAYVDHLGVVTALPSLELGIRATAAEVRSRIVYGAPGSPLPPINDPHQVWSRLFGGFAGDPDERLVQFDKRKSVLDAVQGQFSLLNQRVSSEDRQKLEAHGEMVRELEQRLQLAANSGTGTGGTDGGNGCAKPQDPGEISVDDENEMPRVTQLQLELLAMAFRCDLTRVASIQFSNAINDIRFPWLGSMGSGHSLSHAGPSDADSRMQLVKRGAWFCEQLAYLMSMLDAIPEGDGTVLDNTLIVWCSEVSAGNTHSHKDMPFLIAGGGAGNFKMGRYLQFDGVAHNRLLVSLLNALDVPVDSFGLPEFNSGALSGLGG